VTSFVPDPDWLEKLYAYTDKFFIDRLGPEIRDDAKAKCPVFFGDNSTAGETSYQIALSLGTPMPGGALRDSIEDHLNGHTLIVAATGNDERSYAYFVEEGHQVWVFGRDMGYKKPPQPFLRPALWQVRTAA
jgi:sorbitol-specific phosphotransferase system component IIA